MNCPINIITDKCADYEAYDTIGSLAPAENTSAVTSIATNHGLSDSISGQFIFYHDDNGLTYYLKKEINKAIYPSRYVRARSNDVIMYCDL